MTARQIAFLFAMSAAFAMVGAIVSVWSARGRAALEWLRQSRHRRSVRNSRSDTREPSPKAHADYRAWRRSHRSLPRARAFHPRPRHRT